MLRSVNELLFLKGIPNQIPQIVQEKILMLVQSWSDAFRNTEHLQAFVHCHENLKAQGMGFSLEKYIIDLSTVSVFLLSLLTLALGSMF